MAEGAASAARKPHARMDLTQGPIARTLLLFPCPCSPSVLQSLNGSINTIWVGRLLGPEALTATTNATQHPVPPARHRVRRGHGRTILVGQAIGAKRLGPREKNCGHRAPLLFRLSLVTTLGGLAAADLMEWMGTPLNRVPLAEDYLRIIFLAMPFLCMFAYLVMVQRGAGDRARLSTSRARCPSSTSSSIRC